MLDNFPPVGKTIRVHANVDNASVVISAVMCIP